MASTRGLVRFTLSTASPPLLVRGGASWLATPFGRWMLERVASAMLDWPAVAFHRVELTASGLELVLIAGEHAPARAQFEAVATAFSRELDLASRRGRWVRGMLWSGVEQVGPDRELTSRVGSSKAGQPTPRPCRRLRPG